MPLLQIDAQPCQVNSPCSAVCPVGIMVQDQRVPPRKEAKVTWR